MVMPWIDTVGVIMSDWRNTCAGTINSGTTSHPKMNHLVMAINGNPSCQA